MISFEDSRGHTRLPFRYLFEIFAFHETVEIGRGNREKGSEDTRPGWHAWSDGVGAKEKEKKIIILTPRTVV